MLYGDPILEPRFWAKVRVDASGCWLWTGTRSWGGYGQYFIGGVRWSAHRVSYEALVNWIPDGLEIDHLCRNRPCVNPAHLEAVTGLVNRQRQQHRNGKRERAHCIRGHLFDEMNTYVTKLGQRQCKTCTRERNRRWYQKRLQEIAEARNSCGEPGS